MKTPFTPNGEPFFSLEGIKQLDFFEEEDGTVFAVYMDHVRQNAPTYVLPVFRRKDVTPQAFELLLAAPLLARTIMAAAQGVQVQLDLQEKLKAYFKPYLKDAAAFEKYLTAMEGNLAVLSNMLIASINVPVDGREKTLEILQSPVDKQRS
jgi:hypothetical protein